MIVIAFDGKLKKDGRFWLVHISGLCLDTQGRTKKEAYRMAKSIVIDASGNALPEACVHEDEHSLHVLNYNSPGATGAPAFAAHLVHRLVCSGKLEGLKRKPANFTSPWNYELTVEELLR